MSSHNWEQELLQNIIGEELSSVEFVQDYLQLRFGGATLTAYTQPHVEVGSETLRWNEPRYRDELCAEIGHKVESVGIRPRDAVEIAFDNGVVILISLRDSDYVGAEAAMFDDGSGAWWVI